ncbi:hypothetical protein BFJ63_vAg17543 [Fusarium oxysporum f. sp. narcissi]|uniref:Uncharacterized protein n=1 Tax=Fusarium oxysporum f. sp. narcissi TaxID=451672 RepID=A0A4Q2UZK4_FUSOX|nr:hypothetical protein BFJ63_vAg17543 [Fusarium oxysporum f. sp. narcissi]
MLKFCNPNQDARRDRHLRRYLQRGRKTVNDCATAIQEINKRFTIWSEMTQDLFKALEEMSATKASETDAVKSELGNNEAKKKLKEEEQAREEARLRERRTDLQKIREKKEWYDNHAAKLATGAGVAEGGLVAVATTTAAAVVSGIGIVVGGAAVYLHYSTLRDDLSKMEDDLARRETSIKEMTAEATQLQAALLKLSSEKSSIAQIMKIVQDAVRHVSQLQSRIKSFMEFLEQIASIIDNRVETSEFVHDTAEDTDGMMDPAIKQDLLNNAFDMTTRLTFASRASEIYKTVSAQYIIPTIDGLPNLRLLDAGTDSEINNRLAQLNDMRREILFGTDQLVMQSTPFSIRLLRGEGDDEGHHPDDEQLLSLMPATYRIGIDLVVPRLDDSSCIEEELSLSRIRTIEPWLWLAGLLRPPRPLHHQLLLNREIFITERMDMHLVWTTGRIFIKPIPRFLLEPRFWREFLSCRENCNCAGTSGTEMCERRELWKSAAGFLFSFIALVSYESDFILAQEKHLLPDEISWQDWRTFARQLNSQDIAPKVHARFLYGELRLGRLNKIIRISRFSISRGYMVGWGSDDKLHIASTIAYVALVLTAMQVGLATTYLSENYAFHSASYGFAVFVILGPLIVLGLMFSAFCVTFIKGFLATIMFTNKRVRIIQLRGEKA